MSLAQADVKDSLSCRKKKLVQIPPLALYSLISIFTVADKRWLQKSHNDKGKQLKVSSSLFTKSQSKHKYEELIVSSAAQGEKWELVFGGLDHLSPIVCVGVPLRDAEKN